MTRGEGWGAQGGLSRPSPCRAKIRSTFVLLYLYVEHLSG